MKPWMNSLILASLSLAATSTVAGPINVLWYTGGIASTPNYEANINNLIQNAAAAPGHNSWSITYWDRGAMPGGRYNVLVSASPQGGWGTYPNYNSLVTAAPTFGNRVMVTGQDADWHYLNGPGPSSFNGPRGFLVDAINWASFGSGMGAVLLGANSSNYSRNGGNVLTHFTGLGTETNITTESVTIPQPSASFPINSGLTSAGLSNWLNSAHNSWTGADPTKWKAINTTSDGSAVTLVSAAPAGGTTTLPQLPSESFTGDFKFPLKAVAAPPVGGKPAYQLITQAGGLSSDGSTDDFHKDGGYYSLDLKANENANVVAAASGLVTYACYTYTCQRALDGTGIGPVVTIYHGHGYFTEYREFTKGKIVKASDSVVAGQKIGDFIPGDTNNLVNPGAYTALHFQVKYTPGYTIGLCTDPDSCKLQLTEAQKTFDTGLGLSSESVPQLKSVTLNGQKLDSSTYKFDRNGTILNPIKAVGPPVLDKSLKASPVYSLESFNAIDTITAGSTAMLIEHSPAYLWSDLTIPANAQYFSFEYFWPKRGDGDYLSVFFGNNLLFSSLGLDFTGSDFVSSELISVADFSGQTDQLLFWLNSVGAPNAEVDVRNLTFYSAADISIPEPSSIALVGLALAILLLIGRVFRPQAVPGCAPR